MNTDSTDKIRRSCTDYLLRLEEALSALPLDRVAEFARALADTAQHRGKVYFCGNGGSWTGAQCAARALRRAAVPAQALGSYDFTALDTPAAAQNVFSGFIDSAVTAADLVVGISGSGNSPNILEALQQAQRNGASCWGLGGRDGGKMAQLLGRNRTLLVPCPGMEMLEDGDLFAVEIAANFLARKSPSLAAAHQDSVQALRRWREANQERLADLCSAVIQTAFDESCLFVLGTDLGSLHLRADAGRGWSNCLPIRGFCAPELFTDNSASATVNDDGLSFVLADGLAKYAAKGRRDLALLIDLPGSQQFLEPVRELVAACGMRSFTIGTTPAGQQLDASMLLGHFSPECIVSHVGHLCGEVIRTLLHELFAVRKLEDVKLPAGVRKLSWQETTELEQTLAGSGKLAPDEVVTFAYGEVYAAKSPQTFGLRRVHY